jgi:hypothetical protein
MSACAGQAELHARSNSIDTNLRPTCSDSAPLGREKGIREKGIGYFLEA